jgi:hypothetical protein
MTAAGSLRQVPAATEARPAPPASVEFRYTQTQGFVALLHELGATLLVSTYQANKLLAVRADGGRGCPPWSARSTGPWASLATPAGWPWARAARSGCSATPRTSPRGSSRPGSTTLAFCPGHPT